jgi:hypothetical protein
MGSCAPACHYSLPLLRSCIRRGRYSGVFADGGGTEAVVKVIGEAQHTIRPAAYSFTSKEIASALVAAHKRGDGDLDVPVLRGIDWPAAGGLLGFVVRALCV